MLTVNSCRDGEIMARNTNTYELTGLVLDCLSRHRRPMLAAEIAREIGKRASSVRNRLDVLAKAELILTAADKGRVWFWRQSYR